MTTPSRAQRCRRRCWVWPAAVPFLLVLSLGGGCRFVTPVTGSALSTSTALHSRRLATPQATAGRLVEAVNGGNWRDEYECYTGSQQARFTYLVLAGTREVSDSPDLAADVATVLQKFRFPANLLDRFASQSLDLSGVSNPVEIERKSRAHRDQREARLELWARDVQPLNIDWAAMIGELQPLLVENYQGHLNSDHPSQTGIVRHLGYHLFETVTDVKVDGIRAAGSLVAIVRDPTVEQQDDFVGPSRGMAVSESLRDIYRLVTFADRRLRRDAERIEFLKEGDQWKVTAVPFR